MIVTNHFAHTFTRVMALDLRQNFVSAQYLKINLTEFHQILFICIHIHKIYVGIVTHHFSHICNRVMALDLHQNFESAQYLENKWTYLAKVYIAIYTDKIYVGIISCIFSKICNIVMALD